MGALRFPGESVEGGKNGDFAGESCGGTGFAGEDAGEEAEGLGEGFGALLELVMK